jgi:hypothetical protein
MKTILKTAFIILAGVWVFTSCSEDFLDVNVDPKAANSEQVQVEYFINNSITGAQMDPHVAERAYVLYWKTAARQHRVNGAVALGAYNDGWSSDYYSYLSGWLKTANLAVNVGEEKIANGTDFPYTNNMIQVARIWRVYLMSEFTDNFGPMPVDGFQGENPEFRDEKTVYYFMLDELRDAVSKIDLNITAPESAAKFDKAYGFNFAKWVKYGNSMRLRLAMRLSEVDAAKAKSEFEAAVTGDLIMSSADDFKVEERPGWDPLSGVMTREWNSQPLSVTLNNLFTGLGGISSAEQLPAEIHAQIKPADYAGLRYESHYGLATNDPSAGFWLDGLPNTIDPRAYKAFIIPGWFDNPNFSFFPSWTQDARNTKRNLLDENSQIVDSIDAAFTWNAAPLGNWGAKSARNQVAFYVGAQPRLSQAFRTSTNRRVFFGSWETYFLIAEAAVRGWSTPMNAKTAYESGITASFEFWGVSGHLSTYLASQDYNRVGTSVSWDHTAEPPASVTMNYVNGYTDEAGTHNWTFPNNTLYMNGAVKNDLLTKVITQKYLAQLPWLPLEAWNDHRRLGLPFFENPAVDEPILDLPDLNQSNYMTNHVRFFPQRLKYPSGLLNSNPEGYAQAVSHLGGPDEVLTPLWWAKKAN